LHEFFVFVTPTGKLTCCRSQRIINLNVTVLEALPIDFQKFKEAISSLSRLLLQRRLFPETHPSAEKALSEAYLRIDALLTNKSSVTLKIEYSKIYYLNFEIDIVETKDNAVHLFRETLKKLQIGEIIIANGISKKEISTFAEVLEKSSKCGASGSAGDEWSKIEHIMIRGTKNILSDDNDPNGSTEEKEHEVKRYAKGGTWKRCDKNMRRLVSDILMRLEKIRTMEGRSASLRVLELFDAVGSNTAIVLLLKSLREYDNYTFLHSVNVAVIATALGRKLDLDEEEIDVIGTSGLLHDIGKLYVPRDILLKGGKLSPAEWISVKQHPVDGERILREEGVEPNCRAVAYEHHMRFDHTGYPVPKQGYEISRASHIIRIADSYDALTTKRPYRKQLNPYEAIKLMIKTRGTEFHPEYLDAFMRVLGNIPLGSVLDLDTGERVIVIEAGSGGDLLPRVRVLEDANGNEVEEDIILDLNEIDPRTSELKRRILDVSDNAVRDVKVGRYLLERK
jgi:putative nucleotidyltransferase with HDIG domain